MPRKRSTVGGSTVSSDFVAPGGGSRADLEHLAYTLGLSVDACLAIMNCEGQVRVTIIIFIELAAFLLLFFQLASDTFIIHYFSLFVRCVTNQKNIRALHPWVDDGVPEVYPPRLDYPQLIQPWQVYGVIL